MTEKRDIQLIKQYLKGDQKSLEILVKQYLKIIYSFIYHYIGNATDAEDITQEVFVKAWRSLRRFDQKQNFKAWLFTIAKNSSIDYLRKKRVVPFSALESSETQGSIINNIVDRLPLADEIFDRQNLIQRLNQSIRSLTSQYQEVISLYHNYQLNFREIALALNQPLNTVKSRYRRAIIQLKKHFN